MMYCAHYNLVPQSLTSCSVPVNDQWRLGGTGKGREGSRVDQLGDHGVQYVGVDDYAGYYQDQGGQLRGRSRSLHRATTLTRVLISLGSFFTRYPSSRRHFQLMLICAAFDTMRMRMSRVRGP